MNVQESEAACSQSAGSNTNLNTNAVVNLHRLSCREKWMCFKA